MKRTVGASLALGVFILAGGPVSAQRLTGTVVRADRTPVSDATVLLVGADGRQAAAALSDSLGRFSLRPDGAGTMTLEASHLGYAAWSTAPFELGEDDDLRVVIRLDVAAVPLEELRVEAAARRNSRWLADFNRRREVRAFGGHFLVERDIDRRPMSRPSNLVLEAPGMTVRGGGGPFDRYKIYSGDCLATVFVDGVRINQESRTVDDYLELDRIAGVEIYPRGLAAPPQYQDPFGRECGTVVFWTKELEGDRPGGWSATKVALGVAGVAGLLIIGWAR